MCWRDRGRVRVTILTFRQWLLYRGIVGTKVARGGTGFVLS